MTARRDRTDDVLALARKIAVAAPKRRGKYVSNAGVPWRLIESLRVALAELDNKGETEC